MPCCYYGWVEAVLLGAKDTIYQFKKAIQLAMTKIWEPHLNQRVWECLLFVSGSPEPN